MVNPRELFKRPLTLPKHETDDIHYIGEALPAPSNPATLITVDNVALAGGSAVPAREDHVHDLDLVELDTIVNNSVTNIYEGDTNIYSGGTDVEVETGIYGPTGTFYNEIVFSIDGLITEIAVSPAWPVPYELYIYEVSAVMSAAWAAIGIAVSVGATEIVTETLANSNAVQTFPLVAPYFCLRNYKVTAEVKDIADSTAEDLTIVVRYAIYDRTA